MPLTLLAFDRDAAPSDLQYLTDDNIAKIGAHSAKGLSRTLPKPAGVVRVDRERDDPHREDAAAGSPEGLERCVPQNKDQLPDSASCACDGRSGRDGVSVSVCMTLNG